MEAINLLPKDVIARNKYGVKLPLVTRISIGLLIALVFFASAALALKIVQNIQLKGARNNLALAESKVGALKNKEESVVALKQRLASIKNLSSLDAKRKAIFNLVVYLTPSDIRISDVTVDRNGNMTVLLTSPTLASVETLVSNLGNKEKNAGFISKVDLDNLTLGSGSTYQLSLKITPAP
ncbi:hypothetical protein HY385_03020 [Candidatus Daviesbacteria bacterium]|nr:hypothetical protein [Candidatus Daviesbacteria bacterium]